VDANDSSEWRLRLTSSSSASNTQCEHAHWDHTTALSAVDVGVIGEDVGDWFRGIRLESHCDVYSEMSWWRWQRFDWKVRLRSKSRYRWKRRQEVWNGDPCKTTGVNGKCRKREGARVVWALRGSAVECGRGSESRVGTTVADVM
jgi:hypothetical protein